MRLSWLLIIMILFSACSSFGGSSATAPATPPLMTQAGDAPVAAATQAPVEPAPTDALLLPTQPAPVIQGGLATPTTENTLSSPTATFTAEPTAAVAPVTSLPDPNGYTWQPVATGLRAPVSMAHAGDGSGRLFVVEQYGVIRIIQDGVVQETPYLDIADRITNEGNEQGLLGLAFHPRYTENGFFYVNYTRRDGDTVIARFQVSPADPNLADPNSEKQLMVVAQPFANHNGGAVVFGPDGYLYLALGDGGAAGDPNGNAQSLDTFLGKILRVDVDGGDPYAIPVDNPFAAGGGLPEIWAYGLRNPWRLAFDRVTNELFIADVGQNQWEEINYLPAGASGGSNFGWDYFEGTHPFEGSLPSGTTVIAPVAEYSHAEGGCSVTGGFVYRGQQLPEWQGVYLYGDYCSGLVWGLLRDAGGGWQNQVMFSNIGRIASFGEDEAGEIYLLDRMGPVYVLAKK